MAVVIQGGDGTGYRADVTAANELKVAGTFSAGSEVYIKGGSIYTFGSIWFGGGVGSVQISGTSLPVWRGIGSTLLTGVGSVVISGIQQAWTGVGSVEVNNPSRMGSFTGMSNGSIFWGGGVGSVMISGVTQVVGSFVYATGHVGSVVISGTSIPVWRGTGSVILGGGVGSFVQSGTSQPVWRGTGSIVVSGIPVAWSGAGSVYSFSKETAPNATNMNNPLYNFTYIYSGTSTGVTGSSIGSISMIIGGTTYTKVLTWNQDFITSIGSWS